MTRYFIIGITTFIIGQLMLITGFIDGNVASIILGFYVEIFFPIACYFDYKTYKKKQSYDIRNFKK